MIGLVYRKTSRLISRALTGNLRGIVSNVSYLNDNLRSKEHLQFEIDGDKFPAM